MLPLDVREGTRIELSSMSTSQPRTTSERSDDIPLIIYWLLQLKLHEVLDEALPSYRGRFFTIKRNQKEMNGWVLNPPTSWQEIRLPNSSESEPALLSWL